MPSVVAWAGTLCDRPTITRWSNSIARVASRASAATIRSRHQLERGADLQLLDVLGEVARGHRLVDVLVPGQRGELLDARLHVVPGDPLAGRDAGQVDLVQHRLVVLDHAVGHLDARGRAGPRSTATHSRRSARTFSSADHTPTISGEAYRAARMFGIALTRSLSRVNVRFTRQAVSNRRHRYGQRGRTPVREGPHAAAGEHAEHGQSADPARDQQGRRGAQRHRQRAGQRSVRPGHREQRAEGVVRVDPGELVGRDVLLQATPPRRRRTARSPGR